MGGMEGFLVSLPVDPDSLYGLDTDGVRVLTRDVEQMALRNLEDLLGPGYCEGVAVTWTARVRRRDGREVDEPWTPPAFVQGACLLVCTAFVSAEVELMGGAFALAPVEAGNPAAVMAIEREADRDLEKKAAEAGRVIATRLESAWTLEFRSAEGQINEEPWLPGLPLGGAVRVVYRVEAVTVPRPAVDLTGIVPLS